jgi:hypothetical protein
VDDDDEFGENDDAPMSPFFWVLVLGFLLVSYALLHGLAQRP